MFVLMAILLGIIIGLIRKGNMSGLIKERPFLWILCFFGLLIQLGLHLLFYTGLDFQLAVVVNFLSYVLIILSLVLNFRNPWMATLAAGFFINFLVIFLNGGAMPVSVNVMNVTSTALAGSISNGSNAVYMLMDSGTTMIGFLSDILRIPYVGTITGLYGAVPSISAGTMIILIGIVGWVQGAMAKQSARKKSFFENEHNTFDSEDNAFSDQSLSLVHFDDEDADENDADFFKMGEAILEDQALMRDSDLALEDARYLEEEAITNMTEVIPKLTPEMIAEIRRKALDDSNPQLDIEDDDFGETKVYTALKNLDQGKAEEMAVKDESNQVAGMNDNQGYRIESEVFEDEWWDTDQQNEYETNMPQWDWNWNKQDVTVSDPVDEKNNSDGSGYFMDIKASDLFDDTAETESRKVPNWNPREIERESRQAIREQTANPYSTLFNRTEKKSSKGRSFDEMRDIWHQAYEEDRRRHKNHFSETTLKAPSSDTAADDLGGSTVTAVTDAVAVQPESKPVQVTKYEQARDALAEQWDKTKKLPKLTGLTPKKSTERVDSQEVLRQTLSKKSEEKMIETFAAMERQKAGFEKVELDIDGRIVSFWRKKKQK